MIRTTRRVPSLRSVRAASRVDLAVASGFVVAAVGESVLLSHADRVLLTLGCAGAPVLSVLAVRRRRPVLTVVAIASFAVLGTVLQLAMRPDASTRGGVWMFALLLACYSLGAYARGYRLVIGVLAPLTVVVTTNVPTMTGWAMVNGIVFVTLFVGLLPTAIGAVVRRRREALESLADQRAEVLRQRRAESTVAVLAERLRTTERLRPALLDGLRDLAQRVESTPDVAAIEQQARDLLGRTRHEVVALTAPVPEPVPVPTEADPKAHLTALRHVAQPWAVLTAGSLGAAMSAEALGTVHHPTSDTLVVGTSFLLAAPLLLLCWRPLAAVLVGAVTAAVFEQLVGSVDGTLSGSALALVLAFGVAALSDRRTAVAALLVCWLGSCLRADDPLGIAAILLAAWLGGVAVNEVSDLVEQSRANTRRLADYAEVDTTRAVVEERLRLARELHDVLGHSLTVVAIQAGAARRLARTDPGRADQMRRTIAAAEGEGVAALERPDPGPTTCRRWSSGPAARGW